PRGSRVVVRQGGTVRLARLSTAPFADRLVSKFNLPVSGWRDRVGSAHAEAQDVRSDRTSDSNTGSNTPAETYAANLRSQVLEEIAIENLGVIRSDRVPLSDGLTVITGETGAGKTMVLTGLNLLMGAKADPQSVRPGASSAAVEGRVRVSGRDAVLSRVDE